MDANLTEYTKEEVSPDIIGAMLAEYMTERGGEIYGLGESDIEAIEKLRDSKYSTDEWNCGAKKLKKSERARLDCGTVYIKKKTACGRIEDIRIFGDFMNIGDISKLEADSFFSDRKNAERNFERTQVNEFLTQLEEFPGIVICTTNLRNIMDPAMLRRFHITVDFKALTEEGVKKLLDKFFNDYAFSEKLIHRLCAYDSVTPGDF